METSKSEDWINRVKIPRLFPPPVNPLVVGPTTISSSEQRDSLRLHDLRMLRPRLNETKKFGGCQDLDLNLEDAETETHKD